MEIPVICDECKRPLDSFVSDGAVVVTPCKCAGADRKLAKENERLRRMIPGLLSELDKFTVHSEAVFEARRYLMGR